MVILNGKSIKIKDHPIAIIVQGVWNKYLPLLGYPKDINVCELKNDELRYIYGKIDEKVSGYYGEYDANLLQVWNYNARHTLKRHKELCKKYEQTKKEER